MLAYPFPKVRHEGVGYPKGRFYDGTTSDAVFDAGLITWV